MPCTVHGATRFQAKLYSYLIAFHTFNNNRTHLKINKTFTNNIDRNIYNKIILNIYLPFMENCPNEHFQDFFLHQDNSPINRFEECTQLLENLDIIGYDLEF